MSSEECIAIAEKAIANSLKDHSSAQFHRAGACKKGYWNSVPLLGMQVAFGWLQGGEVNGKNSYGGYVGFRPYRVLMKDGAAVRYCISDKDDICIPAAQ